ncbi:MAG: NuoM family protein [Aquificaceae bacterium]|nr:NuoM family protein [Aquificaceae bacterium]
MEALLNVAIFMPLVASVLVAIVRKEIFSKLLALITSIAGFLITLTIFIAFPWDASGFQFTTKIDWIPQLGISYHVGVDGMAVSLLLLTSLIFIVVYVWSWRISQRPNLFIALFLALQGACMGVFSSLDFFLFYLFWEGMLIPMYYIIGIWGHDRKVYAANKFFIYTFFGSLFLLLGIASLIVYGYFIDGKLSFDYLYHSSKTYPILLQYVAFIAFGIGFAVKVPMWPFHTWLPDAHVEAPTAGSVVLAAVLLKMGTFGFVRYSLELFPDASRELATLVFTLSLISIIYAAMMALAQNHIKKLIAYSSISHMGMVTLGTFANDVNALNGAIFMMVAHGLSSAALFMSAGFIYDRIHSYNMEDLGGLAGYLPKLAVVFMLAGLAGIGFPGLAGFVGEFLILLGTFKNFPFWAFIAGSGIVLSAVYFLHMYRKTMFEEETISDYRKQKWQTLRDLEPYHIISFVAILASAFLLGLYPYPFVKTIEQTSRYIIGG